MRSAFRLSVRRVRRRPSCSVVCATIVAALLAIGGCGTSDRDANDSSGKSNGGSGRKASGGGETRTNAPWVTFNDVTRETGIRVSYDNGSSSNTRTMLETLGGGAAVLDFDLDGAEDLFFLGGGTISAEHGIRGQPFPLERHRRFANTRRRGSARLVRPASSAPALARRAGRPPTSVEHPRR